MVGWIVLALLGVIVAAFFIPIRIRVEYIEKWAVQVYLFGAICVWTLKDTETETKTLKKNKTKNNTEDKPSTVEGLKSLFREEGVGGVMRFFGKLVELLKTTLSSLAKYITVRKLALCVRVGAEEADDAATLYGKISAGIATGLAVLSQLVRIRKPCVRVIPDFTADHTEVRLRMVLWLWPFGVVGVGIAAVWRFIMLWATTMKTPSTDVKNTMKQPVSK